jgi:hypothetical protein
MPTWRRGSNAQRPRTPIDPRGNRSRPLARGASAGAKQDEGQKKDQRDRARADPEQGADGNASGEGHEEGGGGAAADRQCDRADAGHPRPTA